MKIKFKNFWNYLIEVGHCDNVNETEQNLIINEFLDFEASFESQSVRDNEGKKKLCRKYKSCNWFYIKSNDWCTSGLCSYYKT